MKGFHKCIVNLLFWLEMAKSHNILAILPVPLYSHQIVANAYLEELAKSGHQVVVITPLSEVYTNKLKNFKIISVKDNVNYREDVLVAWSSTGKRASVKNIENAISNEVFSVFADLENIMFKNIKLKTFLLQKQEFDLIIVEDATYLSLILGHIYDAPIIRLSSFYASYFNMNAVGAVGFHPKFYPNFNRNKFFYLTFWDTVYQTYLEWRLSNEFDKMERKIDSLLKEEFGIDSPTVKDLSKRIVLILLNVHPVFDNNRPVPSSLVYVGGLHLKSVAVLPEALKTYLDSNVNGTVYVSFGTNVDCNEIEDEFFEVFLKAFEALPYNVLWKCDRYLPQRPKNLRIEKWFPQRDLLAHEKIKAFVTQGGILSTEEAIDSAVPMVGIPMLGDQWYNTAQYERLGIGIALDPHTFTHEDLISAVNNVIDDVKYKKNLQELRTLINDQPMTSMQRAIWWTEFVLRHEGRNQGPLGAHLNGVGESKQRSYGAYLKGATAGVTWAEWLMLDVVVIVLSIFVIVIIISAFLCYFSVKFILNKFVKKKKAKNS